MAAKNQRQAEHRGQDRLSAASAHIPLFLQQAIQRGHVLTTTLRLLNQLLDDYGRDELHSALDEALKQQSPYPQAVQQILERRRDEKRQPPPLAVAVPDKVKPYHIKAVNLAEYDQLNPSHEDGPVNDSETEQDKEKEKKKEQKKEPENAITAITKEENHD